MAKARVKLISRRPRRRPKRIRRVPRGVIYVQAGFNNTIVTITDPDGQVVSSSSAGHCGFRSKRKASPFAAETTAQTALCTVAMQRAEILVKGGGIGRDAALRAISRSGIKLTLIRDVTPLPHNGCRPPKRRRV
uniref:Ribosomal protein S11 n=1 Tax=Downingia cuspidata TaxID=101772 RepID=A0A1Z2QT15_9ASTR|nr:ribosomal protein S11 [Downingia cuspidata]ASA34632.1 ribosomal protein S11 [Downingia cuspidata]